MFAKLEPTSLKKMTLTSERKNNEIHPELIEINIKNKNDINGDLNKTNTRSGSLFKDTVEEKVFTVKHD